MNSKGSIDIVEIPQNSKNRGTLFLLNTGRSRKTEPLVNLFLEKCKNNDFQDLHYQILHKLEVVSSVFYLIVHWSL